MSEYTFYLPIKSVNLPHYFVKGIISPVKYIENRNIDIQNRFEDYLLLSNSPFTSETNCALELVFEKQKEDAKRISDNFFLFEKPLPISRIKQVIFQDEKQKNNSVFSISSGGAFLPENLLKVLDEKVTIDVTQLDEIDLQKKGLIDWTKPLTLFNRLMGGFALMRVSGEDNKNYPVNYFNLLSVLNNYIRDIVVKQEIPISKKYDWAIKDDGKQEKLYRAIYSKITNNDVAVSADDEGIDLRKKNGKILIADEGTRTYLINILASYGESARMSLDSFFSDFNSDKFQASRKEGIALIFGLNKGYEVFRNSYKTQNFEVDIKFKLDNQLDYYTIESIYQYSINSKIENTTFDYLDIWCNKANDLLVKNDLMSYTILDRHFYYKKKEAGYSESFRRYFDELNKSDLFKIRYSGLVKELGKEKELKDLLYLSYLHSNEKNKSSEPISYDTQKTKNDIVHVVAEPPSDKYGEVVTSGGNDIGRSRLKRQKELESLNITKLKEEGKKCQIKGYTTYKNTPEGKQALLAKILEKEFAI